jgi:hypothetical protein
MTLQPRPLSRVVLAVGVLLAMTVGLAGCGAPTSTQTSSSTGSSTASHEASGASAVAFDSSADTAQGHYAAALKSVKAVAPDAVLVVVQTEIPATSTPSAVWIYLFASKKMNKAYAVTVSSGKPGKPLALATESLRADEWAKVPPVTAWKIDSDEAFKKAFAAYAERLNSTPPKQYSMGMALFVADTPENNASGVKPLVWSVTFDPSAGGVTATRQALVDAKTGAVLTGAE